MGDSIRLWAAELVKKLQTPVSNDSRVFKNHSQSDELGWKLLHLPQYSPDQASSDYYMFSNEEIEWKTDGYFETLDKSRYLKGI